MEKTIFISLQISELQELIVTSVQSCLLHEKNYPQKKDNNRILNVSQTAEFLSLSVPTIYSKVSKGELPYMKRGKRLYFSKKDLVEYLEDGKQPTKIKLQDEVQNFFKKKGGSNV